MKITTKSDYALTIMIELAKSKPNQVIPLGQIAAKYSLSLSYLEQLATKLRLARLIHSKQGVTGGYFLARKSKNITANQIIEAVGDEISAVNCSNHKGKDCPKYLICKTKKAWDVINEKLNLTFKSTTLAELSHD